MTGSLVCLRADTGVFWLLTGRYQSIVAAQFFNAFYCLLSAC